MRGRALTGPLAAWIALGSGLMACTDRAAPSALEPTETRPPNFLLLVADDVGVDMLSIYGVGTDLPRTPVIDGLARDGVRFLHAWSAPACSATRATIQTGRYGFRTGIGWLVRWNGYALPPSEMTLPEMLDQYASVPYQNAAFGKWHLGNESVGGLRAPNVAGYAHFSGTLFNLGNYFSWQKVVDGQATMSTRYATSDTVDSVLAWTGAASEPWLAYVAFHAAHAPFHAPPAELHSVDLTGAGNPKENPRPYYKAMIESLDSEMGRLLEGLPPDVVSRTTVIFVGDNGTQPYTIAPPFDSGRAKDTLYEGGIHIPFVVSGAGVKEPGRTSGALIHTTDILATVAELAGIDPAQLSSAERRLDSVSFASQLRGSTAPPARETVFAERFLPSGFHPDVWSRAARNERYKLIVHQFAGSPDPSLIRHTYLGPEEFYDLAEDPLEHRNLLPFEHLSPAQRGHYDALKRAISDEFRPR